MHSQPLVRKSNDLLLFFPELKDKAEMRRGKVRIALVTEDWID